MANRMARWSLPTNYAHLTDYMSGFIALNLDRCLHSSAKWMSTVSNFSTNYWPSAKGNFASLKFCVFNHGS